MEWWLFVGSDGNIGGNGGSGGVGLAMAIWGMHYLMDSLGTCLFDESRMRLIFVNPWDSGTQRGWLELCPSEALWLALRKT